jgi:hypothetical protein
MTNDLRAVKSELFHHERGTTTLQHSHNTLAT